MEAAEKQMNQMKDSIDRLQIEKKELETKYNRALERMKETEADKENINYQNKKDVRIITDLKKKFNDLKLDYDFVKKENDIKEEKVQKLERVNTELTEELEQVSEKMEFYIQRESELTELVAELKSK